MTAAFAYRPEIDGMRALAVVAVILFHIGLPGAGGGFGGVDVFFVISGYLITSIVADEMATGRFSFATFYQRRIRRLLPPLIPVLLFSWLLSYAMLNIWEFSEYARSLRAVVLLAANWNFLGTVGYFGAPAETKPLLHFWSLAVEEQFYLIFPALLFLLARAPSALRGRVVLLLAAASLALNIFLAATGKADGAFFNSFARFWEILAGSLLALYPMRTQSRRLATGLELVGMAALLALFSLPAAPLFPTQSAVVAVIGASLLIAAGGRGAIISPLLGSRAFVATGKVSYALYLWHWPIIVVIRTAHPDAGLPVLAAGMLLALALATLSYWAIENPVRKSGRRFRGRWEFGLLLMSILAFGGLSLSNQVPALAAFKSSVSTTIRGILYGTQIGGALVVLDDAAGNVARLDVYYDGNSGPFTLPKHANLPCSFDNGNSADHILECLVAQATESNVLLLGDSIGRDTLHALRAAHPQTNFLMLHQSSCPPADFARTGSRCFPGLADILTKAQDQIKLKAVLLAYRYLPEEWTSISTTLDALRAAGVETAVLGVSPVFQQRLSDHLRQLPYGATVPEVVSKSDRTMLGWDLDAMAADAGSLASAHGALFVNTLTFFCPGDACPLWIGADRAHAVFWDAQHLTLQGIQQFSEYLARDPSLDRLLSGG